MYLIITDSREVIPNSTEGLFNIAKDSYLDANKVVVVLSIPYLASKGLCSKLSKGVGHNYYGEPAWPNDILYIFPVAILGVLSILLGLPVSTACGLSERAAPFPHPLEILPEWYFFATFNLLRILSSKFIGVLSMLSLPLFLALLPFLENLVKYQSPFRRPAMSVIYIFYVAYAIWLSLGSRHHH